MPRYKVQKYVTAIHRRKLVNCGGGPVPKAPSEVVSVERYPLSIGVRSGARKKFRFCPASKCWTFMHAGLWRREIVQQL